MRRGVWPKARGWLESIQVILERRYVYVCMYVCIVYTYMYIHGLAYIVLQTKGF